MSRGSQLPLEVGPADEKVFASYYAGPNDGLVHALNELATIRQRGLLWFWGPSGSGRSHLLQATVNAAAESGARAGYIPLTGDGALKPHELAGFDTLDVIGVDDVDAVAGDEAWERALFNLFEALRRRGGRLAFTATLGPLHTGLKLPDLVSRFSAAATFRMRELSDGDKRDALQARARWRGVDLPDETVSYLLTRVERSPGHLFALLDRLDRAAMAAQKRLTVPFVRDVLAESEEPT